MQQQQEEQPGQMKTSVQSIGAAVDSIEDKDEDCIRLAQAALQALSFDKDLPLKCINYRPYKGSKLRIFKLLGSLYGMSQAPMDWYMTLHGWIEERID